jgi:hypothetical protein
MTRRGQSLVESALVLAAFMGLLLGMATAGESLFVKQTLADRARLAARWGSLHRYDAAAIQRVVLYGTAEPGPADSPFFSFKPDAVEVSNPGCPGVECRVVVALPSQGVRAVEPASGEAISSPTPSQP